MSAQDVIRSKRLGNALSEDQIGEFVNGIVNGDVSDAQMAAFAMAVCWQGMTFAECVAFTQAMRDSGAVLNWARLSTHGPVVDKHSSGGVGDNVSLVLAPLLAATGAYVPMVSGRGLGHTGGTLDKLDAIPGYQSQPAMEIFQHAVQTAGCAIAGATRDIAPADKALYAVRDVTATVESVPLITASILSKKLAAGLDALVLDIKTGSGAFMADIDSAKALAHALTDTANAAGLATRALITDMDQPLASCAGNGIEVNNAVAVLKGEHSEPRLMQVVSALAESVLQLSGHARDQDDAAGLIHRALSSGEAAERFARMVAAMGGPRDFVERPGDYLAHATKVIPVVADRDGWIEHINTRELGLAIVALGAGRSHVGDYIDYAVGVDQLLPVGTRVQRNQPLARIHAKDQASAEATGETVRRAFMINSDRQSSGGAKLILHAIAPNPVSQRHG